MAFDKSLIDGINLALNESRVSGIRMRKGQTAAEVLLLLLLLLLLLVVDALPEIGPMDPDARRVLVLHSPSRIQVLLRTDRPGEPLGPAIPLASLDDIESFFSSLTWADAMYGWPFVDGGDEAATDWPDPLSLEIDVPGGSRAHSLYWFAECGSSNGRWPGSFFLQGRIAFGDLEVTRADCEQVSLEDFVAGARRWWEAFRMRDERVSVGAQRTAQEGTPKWRAWQVPSEKGR